MKNQTKAGSASPGERRRFASQTLVLIRFSPAVASCRSRDQRRGSRQQMIGSQKQTARPLGSYLSLIEDKPKDYQNMKRLLKTTAKTVASVLAAVALLSSASYAGQTTRHHEYTATALKKECRWVFLFWRSCTYSYVGANQVSKTRAKLPNSEIDVGFYTGSIFARTGRPASISSSALWGNTSTDVGFSGGRTSGSSPGSALGGSTGGSLSGNNSQQGSGASNQGGGQGGQNGTGSGGGKTSPDPVASDNGDTLSTDESNQNGKSKSEHSDNGHGNDPNHTDPSNPGKGGGNHGTGNKGK